MLDKYPRRDVAYIATASGVTLVDRREPRVVDLDSLGAHIWLRIDGVSSLGDIADRIAERYNQSPEKTRAAVEPKCREIIADHERTVWDKNGKIKKDAERSHMSEAVYRAAEYLFPVNKGFVGSVGR